MTFLVCDLLLRALVFALLSGFALVAVGLDPLRAQPGSPAVYAAVWQVYNATGSGTAFAIGSPKRNRFVTNAHVIVDLFKAKGGEISLWKKGSKYALTFHRLVAISTTYDLAVFETKEPVLHRLRFAEAFDKDKAENLYVVGYPGNTFAILRQTAKIAYEDGFSYEFAVNRKGHPKRGLKGISGGPVLNARGEVVMLAYSVNDNLLSGIKGELARRLAAGDAQVGVVCSVRERARRCLAKAIERTTISGLQGDVAAQSQLSSDKYINTGELARAWRFKAAGNGSARAQQSLGFDYAKKADLKAARYWLEKAAESNRPVATYNLGYIYFNPQGQDIAQDDNKAFALFLRSARSGYNKAQFAVGVSMYRGWGTAVDRDGARSWIEKAAATGHVKARKFLKDNY